MRRRLADRRGNPTIDAGPLPVDFMSHPPEIDPNGIGQHEPGAKLDAGKLRPWLCIGGFSRALEEVAKVTTVGARKYSPNGWKAVPDGKDRYMDAAVRHMIKCGQGEKVDRDTGCLHHAQVIWNLLASLELELQEREEKAG
jgi:hypothetical protein